MALIDTFMLGLLKAIHLGWVGKTAMFLPTIVYSLQPWIFASALKYESMTVMNLLWDVMSDMMVTASGLYFFKEKLSRTKILGVSMAIIAITLMAWPGEELI
jgi:multidrug transporter EmrE-like cation transporter